MPDKDGIETLQELKLSRATQILRRRRFVRPPTQFPARRKKYLAESFDNYLTKPINPNKLEEMLLKYLPAEKMNAKRYLK